MFRKTAGSVTPRHLTLRAMRWGLLGTTLLAAGCHDDIDIRGWEVYALAFRIAELVVFIIQAFD
ncbi:MAG: hypothetical protein L6R00_01755 [Phycisphaerae bacterium]|nr:hypothetical protein [Phycisphaerae bacterium]